MVWLWWLAGAIIAGAIEIVTLDLIFLMLCGGAVIATVVAACGLPLWIQAVVFAVASLALLTALRPFLLSHLKVRKLHVTGAHKVVGQVGQVVLPVDSHGGRVKVGGQVWTARSDLPGAQLGEGAAVAIVRIDGATAVVSPLGHVPAASPATDGSQG